MYDFVTDEVYQEYRKKMKSSKKKNNISKNDSVLIEVTKNYRLAILNHCREFWIVIHDILSMYVAVIKAIDDAIKKHPQIVDEVKELALNGGKRNGYIRHEKLDAFIVPTVKRECARQTNLTVRAFEKILASSSYEPNLKKTVATRIIEEKNSLLEIKEQTIERIRFKEETKRNKVVSAFEIKKNERLKSLLEIVEIAQRINFTAQDLINSFREADICTNDLDLLEEFLNGDSFRKIAENNKKKIREKLKVGKSLSHAGVKTRIDLMCLGLKKHFGTIQN